MSIFEFIGLILTACIIAVFIYLRKEIALAFIIKNAMDSLEPVKKEELFAHNEREIERWRDHV